MARTPLTPTYFFVEQLLSKPSTMVLERSEHIFGGPRLLCIYVGLFKVKQLS